MVYKITYNDEYIFMDPEIIVENAPEVKEVEVQLSAPEVKEVEVQSKNSTREVEIELHQTMVEEVKIIRESSYQTFVDDGYRDLVAVVGNKKYDASNMLDLAAICIPITKRMVGVSNKDRKRILIIIVNKYVDNENLSDYDRELAKISINALDSGIDVLFNFRKGQYDECEVSETENENVERACNCCMMMFMLAFRIADANSGHKHSNKGNHRKTNNDTINKVRMTHKKKHKK